MTVKELCEKLNSKTFNLLFSLYERWQEEYLYEDLSDYLVAIQKVIPEASEIKSTPFQVTCSCSDGQLLLTVTDDDIEIKAVKGGK